MRRVIDLIKQNEKEIEKGKLFQWLSDESVDPYQRLSFTPSMLYYLMGFKDVLAHLAVKNPSNVHEKHINAYCVEDAEHWRWYLDDLTKLGYTVYSWGDSIPKFCNEVWSPATVINRKTIFTLIYYSKLSTDPLLKLVLIQIFESTGVVFIGHTRKAAIAMGADDDLFYFGKVHYEEEFGHTVQSNDLVDIRMGEETYNLAVEAVENLFGAFDEMFNCWYEHRDKYPVLGKVSVGQKASV